MLFSLSRDRKGNVTIAVLLLMVSSGLLALLTLQFVKHFLTSSSVLENYYKAYYMARGGLETLLTEGNMRGYGFQYDLDKAPTIQQNFYNNCLSSGLCTLQGKIVAHGESISDSPNSLYSRDCKPEDMITLSPGNSSAYPLFYDRGVSDNLSFAGVKAGDFSKIGANSFGFNIVLSGGDLDSFLYNATLGTFGNITASEQLSPTTVSSFFGQESFTDTHWLIISNPKTATSAVSYCITSDETAQQLVGNYTEIISQATYRDKTVGVTALKKFVFPSAFIQ